MIISQNNYPNQIFDVYPFWKEQFMEQIITVILICLLPSDHAVEKMSVIRANEFRKYVLYTIWFLVLVWFLV